MPFLQKKGVQDHPDKSSFIVCGSRKHKKGGGDEGTIVDTTLFWSLQDEAGGLCQVHGYGTTRGRHQIYSRGARWQD